MVVLVTLLLHFPPHSGATAQELPPPPPDTFADALSRELVVPAWEDRRHLIQSGLQLVLAHRIRVGLEVPDQWLWRDRSLFRREQAALFQLHPGGRTELDLVASARGSPMVGDASLESEGIVALDPEEERAFLGVVDLYLEEVANQELIYTGAGQIRVLGETFADPIAPEASLTYRYRGTDTIRVELPEPTTLIGVAFSPRSDMRGFTGILWFDASSHRLIRFVGRPDGAWDLSAGLSGPLADVPLLPRNARGSVDYLVVEFRVDPGGRAYPSRAITEGSLRWLGNAFSMPVRMEWTAERSRDRIAPLANRAVPLPDSVRATYVPPPLSAGWDFTVPRRALNPFLRELDRVVSRPPPPTLKQAGMSVLGGIRFNQVQGLSLGIEYPYPMGSRETLTGEFRVATTSFQPTGSLEFRRQLRPIWWSAQAYSQLQDANRWEAPLGIWNSLEALLFGQDDGNYFLATGASVSIGGENRPLTWSADVFGERHDDTPSLTTFSLFGTGEDEAQAESSELVADEGEVYGLRAQARLQWGDDPQRGLAVLRGAGEWALGDFQYRDIELQLDLVGQPAPGLATAGRVAAGRAMGDVPTQRLYHLGGRKTVRGFQRNAASGKAYFLLKAEVGTALPAMRVVSFLDAGWSGEPSKLFQEKGLMSVGLGLSLLDGVFRTDLAWGIQGGDDIRIHFYTSGLF
jgi:hypothetical protein